LQEYCAEDGPLGKQEIVINKIRVPKSENRLRPDGQLVLSRIPQITKRCGWISSAGCFGLKKLKQVAASIADS